MGVKAHKHGFVAYIRDHKARDGAKTYCGYAATAEEAARLYDAKATEIYGRGAVLNFPTPSQPKLTKESTKESIHPAVRVSP